MVKLIFDPLAPIPNQLEEQKEKANHSGIR